MMMRMACYALSAILGSQFALQRPFFVRSVVHECTATMLLKTIATHADTPVKCVWLFSD